MKTRITNQIIHNSRVITIIMILMVSVIAPIAGFSQHRETAVSNASGDQINPVMATDMAGGTIIAWQDRRNGKYEIFAQRLNPSGQPIWSSNGIPICTLDSNYNPKIVTDFQGGVVISWQAYRGSSTADIYAQRVDPDGDIQWSLNGVLVCSAAFDQTNISMVNVGLGGTILTWQDYRSNNGFADIYTQRINSSGVMEWTANGVGICTEASEQGSPKIVSDNNGGAFITWHDNRAGNFDIYTQLVNSGGAPVWTTNGVATCTMGTDQLKPDICVDGAGGAIVVWYDERSTTDSDIYAQRIGAGGGIVWAVDGIVMNNNVGYDQIDPQIVSDDLGGAIMSWTDYRTGVTSDIYAQRTNSTGAVQWTATGVIICTESGDQIYSQLVSDGNNGAYITWEDHRNIGNADIYAQRIASNAAINWAATGFPICTVGENQLRPNLVSNGNLGAIVVWQDYRSANNYDIYAVGFNTSGVIGITGNGTNLNEFTLSQNYPNPFNPSTSISYQLPVSGVVELTIYNVLGTQITTLVNGLQTAGSHSVVWNAASFTSGVYFYRLETESFVSVKKMLLIK